MGAEGAEDKAVYAGAARQAIGFLIIFCWQVVGVNLFRWDGWAKSQWALKDRNGSYTMAGSALYACLGLLLIVLRLCPPALVKPRHAASKLMVGKSFTRNCPDWYREYATQVIARWIDDTLSVVYCCLALKLICRFVPWALELSSYIVPSLGSFSYIVPSWGSLLSPQHKVEVYNRVFEISTQVMFTINAILFGRMLLLIKHPSHKRVTIPPSPEDALRGAAIPWRPLIWFIVVQRKPKLRTQSMRFLLLDKCLTCAIYASMAVPVLRLLNLRLQTVLAVGGVGGLAIGLALQNLVQNLISGILIYINSSVCEGLEVELVEAKCGGVVSKVGWFNTKVNRYDGMRVLVPNRRILDGTVVDKTNKCFRLCDEQLLVIMADARALDRLVSNVQAMLRDDAAVLQARDVIRIRDAHEGNIKIYPPQFIFQGWSDYGAKFRIIAYFSPRLQTDAFLREKSRLLLALNQQVGALGGAVGFSGFSGGPLRPPAGSLSSAVTAEELEPAG